MTLRDLDANDFRTLMWRQPSSFSRDSDLRAGDLPVGTLSFRSGFGTHATGVIGDDCFTFKRVGFWQQRVSVRHCNDDREYGEFVNATWSKGGTLTLAGGRTYRATSNFWNTKWQIEDSQGRVVVRFDYGGAFKLAAVVDVPEDFRTLPDLALLVLLSWYLVVMLASDAGAAVG